MLCQNAMDCREIRQGWKDSIGGVNLLRLRGCDLLQILKEEHQLKLWKGYWRGNRRRSLIWIAPIRACAGERNYICFVDMKEAFDRASREIVEWAVTNKGVPEIMVIIVMSLSEGASARIKVRSGYCRRVFS